MTRARAGQRGIGIELEAGGTRQRRECDERWEKRGRSRRLVGGRPSMAAMIAARENDTAHIVSALL